MRATDLKAHLLKKAYELTDDITPLEFDCGKLCSSLCCKENVTGSAQHGGMQLLPGEDSLLTGKSGFEIKNTADGNILICKAMCDRAFRPFMCRIFPYYAHFSHDENMRTRISLLPDPRALRLCPLVSGVGRKHRMNIFFKRNMKRAVRLLLRDKEIKDEFIKTSEFCDSLYELYRKMIK